MKCNTIPDLERFLVIQEQALGTTAPEVANTISKLAELYFNKGDLDKAEVLFERAHEIQSHLSGIHREGIEQTEERLLQIKQAREEGGSVRGGASASVDKHARGKTSSATDKQQHLGAATSSDSYHPVTASGRAAESRSRSGVRSSSTKAIENAIAEAELELELLRQMVGPEHTSVADLLTKIADLYCRLRLYNKMEPLLVDALKIRELACGGDHVSVSTELKNLGALYCAQERFALAEPLLKRAIAIREKSYGRSHPRVADVEEHYAQLLRKTNRIALAEAMEVHINEIRSQYDSPSFARNGTFFSANW